MRLAPLEKKKQRTFWFVVYSTKNDKNICKVVPCLFNAKTPTNYLYDDILYQPEIMRSNVRFRIFMTLLFVRTMKKRDNFVFFSFPSIGVLLIPLVSE